MKKLLLTTALTSLIAVSATSFAADSNNTTDPASAAGTHMNNSASQMKGHVAGKMVRDQMEADAKRLNLTPDQKTKIKDLMKESKMELDQKIRAQLDDKQKVEFDKIQAEHKAQWEKNKSDY